MDREQGQRLREFLRATTGGRHGWVSALAREAHLQRQTVYLWFEGKADPSLESLGELARVTGRSRAEIVAAMDGQPDEPVEERVAALERAVEGLLRPTAPEAEGSPGPRAPRAKAG